MAKTEMDRGLLERRLKVLQSELENGQKMLADLDAKRVNLTNTMLRIEGAIELMRELLAAFPATESPAAPADSRLELVGGTAGTAGKDG